ncbi:MAG: hypothetical protein HY866_08730 [Chloroflexi bacterium]|nr:hypothetical protein [Chloroflexota bacterium]
MKTVVRLAIVVVMLVVMLPLASVHAEGDETYAGFFIQEAESGTMIDNMDGTYTLTLEGVGEDTEWLVSTPYAGVGAVSTGELAQIWASHPDGLVAQAVLEIDDVVVSLSLTAPVFDAENESISYTATVVVPEGEKDAPEVAAEFESAVLYIVTDDALLDGLKVGAENNEARPTLQCTKIYSFLLGWQDNCKWVP